jgi:diadenosine tetraphosphatase ApaH/serine/threonine PP2A family protein phosphatase
MSINLKADQGWNNGLVAHRHEGNVKPETVGAGLLGDFLDPLPVDNRLTDRFAVPDPAFADPFHQRYVLDHETEEIEPVADEKRGMQPEYKRFQRDGSPFDDVPPDLPGIIQSTSS